MNESFWSFFVAPPGKMGLILTKHIARTLGRNLIVRRASDLLGMYVGQTEAQIAQVFEEAERTKSILFFDEADSFLQDRTGAHQNHEVSKVNEILTRKFLSGNRRIRSAWS